MNGMHQFDAWVALSKDRGNRHLHEVKIVRMNREMRAHQPARRTWLAQRTGRILRSVGGRLVTMGKQLECGCEACVLTGHTAGAA